MPAVRQTPTGKLVCHYQHRDFEMTTRNQQMPSDPSVRPEPATPTAPPPEVPTAQAAIPPGSPTGPSPTPSTPSNPSPVAPSSPAAVEWVALTEIVREAYPAPAKPIEMPSEDGTDPDKIGQLADRIRATGRFDPIHVDEGLRVLDGRRRHAAAVLLDWDRVPVMRVCGLTEEQKWAWAWTQAARREFTKVPRAEREAMTRDALRRLHRYSDAYVSGLVAESERTVAERRAAMIDAGEIPDHARLVGLDGKTYEVRTRARKLAEEAERRAAWDQRGGEARRQAEEAERRKQEAEEKLTPEEKAERDAKERREEEEREQRRDAEYLRNDILGKEEPLVVEVPADIGPLPRGRYLVRYSHGSNHQTVGRALRRSGYLGIIDLYPGPQPKPPAVAPPPEAPPERPADAPQPPPGDQAPHAEPLAEQKPAQEPPTAEQGPPAADRLVGRPGKKAKK